MKYAIISDIHGNIIALKEAMKLIDEENVEKIICLGDIIGIGTRSEECVNFVRQYEDKLIAVRGNHEDRCLFGIPEYIHDGKHKMSEEDMAQEHWIQDHISDESKDFLRGLPQEIEMEIEGYKFVITHYPSKEDMSYERFSYFPVKEELFDLFKKYGSAKVYLFGHTHERRIRETKEGIWFINPGTLGTAFHRDYGTYGILTIEDGKFYYNEKSFKYDIEAYMKDFDVMNPPRGKHMQDQFFGYKA
ncbi:MAG: metallophosphoesterase family protein [Clostridia bacterium]|nr:metallophosphoesterase family protein [Clostridia bacterium]